MKRSRTEQRYRRSQHWPGFLASALLMALPLIAKGQAPAADFQPLDLKRFYNGSLNEATQNVSGVPQGKQVLGGTPFLIGGKIEVTGLDVASRGEFLPPQITGIPIAQKFTRLHLLHGASHGQRDGTPLANLVLHYKNGQSRSISLAFVVHTRNCTEEHEGC